MNVKRVLRKTLSILKEWMIDPITFCNILKVFWAFNMLAFVVRDNVAGLAVSAFFYACTVLEHHAYYTAPVRREGVLVIRAISDDKPFDPEEEMK